MSEGPRTLVVVNERAGGGAMADVFRRAEHRLEDAIGAFDLAFTDRPGHATLLTRRGLEEGARRILVAGGDGTVNEAANAFFDDEGESRWPDAVLGFVPGGTGGDLRKTLGVPDLETALRAAAAGSTRAIDVGRLTYTGTDDRKQRVRYFLNITSFGISGLVDRYVKGFGMLPGQFAYAAASLRAMLTYRNARVRLRVEGAGEAVDETLEVNTIAVANGRFFGGGMMIAPEAEIDDGRFDITVLGNLGFMEVVGLTRSIYKGTHVQHPKVSTYRGTTVKADSDEEVLLDVDGEPLGQLPARFELLPRALKVLVP